MNNVDLIRSQISSSIDVKNRIINSNELLDKINILANYCTESLKNGNKIIFAGNGGSFADSQHLSAEFVCRFMFDRDPLPSIALGTNSSLVTAVGNDYSFNDIFSRELEVLSCEGDVFIPITTSGNSGNILKASKVAIEKKLKVMGLSGKDGGELANLIDMIIVPSDDTGRIQESHITIGHIVCEIVEKELFSTL